MPYIQPLDANLRYLRGEGPIPGQDQGGGQIQAVPGAFQPQPQQSVPIGSYQAQTQPQAPILTGAGAQNDAPIPVGDSSKSLALTTPTEPPPTGTRGTSTPIGLRVSGSSTEQLTGPVAGRVGQESQQLDTEVGAFNAGAGPTGQTFEGRGGPATVTKGISIDTPKEDQPAAKGAVHGLATSAYGGPKFLGDPTLTPDNPDAFPKLEKDIGDTAQFGGNISGGAGGVANVLKSSIPGITPGEARQEARGVESRPGFQGAAQGAEQAAQGLAGRLGFEQNAADKTVATRTKEEADIAQKTIDTLQSTGQATLGAISDEEKKRQALNDQVTAAMAEFEKTGDWSVFDKIPQDALGFDLGKAKSQWDVINKQTQEAEAKFNDITQRYAAKFPTISQFGPLHLAINEHGQETYGITIDGKTMTLWDAHTRGLLTMDQVRALKARQKEYDQYFSPGSYSTQKAGGLEAFGQQFRGKLGLPQGLTLADIMPLYYGEGKFSALDPRSFLDTMIQTTDKWASQVTQANTATEAQRYQINAIHDILDELGKAGDINKIEDPEKAWHVQQVAFRVKDYLDEEQKAIDERVGTVDKEAKDWANAVRKARAKYRSLAQDFNWGDVAVSAAVSSLYGPVYGPIVFGVNTYLQHQQRQAEKKAAAKEAKAHKSNVTKSEAGPKSSKTEKVKTYAI